MNCVWYTQVEWAGPEITPSSEHLDIISVMHIFNEDIIIKNIIPTISYEREVCVSRE